MKFILSLLASLFLLISSSVLPVFAAPSPGVTMTTSRDRHFVYLTFTGLKTVSRVSYTLTYDTNTTQKGFEGGFKTSKFSNRSVRRQIIGTCSTRRCTYHTNPKNFRLVATFYLRSGGSTTVTKSLP